MGRRKARKGLNFTLWTASLTITLLYMRPKSSFGPKLEESEKAEVLGVELYVYGAKMEELGTVEPSSFSLLGLLVKES